MIRVQIVDDHEMFAESIARRLEREADIEIVGTSATSADAVVLACAAQPDVTIVDYALPDADGIETSVRIRSVSPGTRLLLLTGLPDDGVATVAVQAGCSGFLTKDKATHELVTAVRVVHAGKAFIPPSHLADLHRGLATERIKSEFMSRVNHEFRSPLTAILGYGHLLERRPMRPEQVRELAREIVASGCRLQRIVEILEFTASCACGEFALDAVPVDAWTLLESAQDRWSKQLDASHQFVVDASSAHALVLADTKWLSMAIDELIDNAAKFSPGGGGIHLAARRVDCAGQPGVEFAIRDEGVGMSPFEREMAFEEFMQMDSSDTRTFGGLGLGLSLVRRVAEAHGGAVSCDPVRPAGTRTAISIPAAS